MATDDTRTRHSTLSVLNIDSNGLVSFGFNAVSPTFSRGVELLLQNIIIYLFTTETSNIFHEEIGGSLYEIIGKGYQVGQEDLIKAEFILAFSTVETQIKAEQLGDSSLLPEEKLKGIDLLSLEYDSNTYTWKIDIKVRTVGGEAALFTINN